MSIIQTQFEGNSTTNRFKNHESVILETDITYYRYYRIIIIGLETNNNNN